MHESCLVFAENFYVGLEQISGMNVPTVAGLMAEGKTPDILLWVGWGGSFDQRAQSITKAFATILDKTGIRYAIIGKEEMCTGDPLRRAGNEFMFKMMAYQNI